MTGQGLYKDFYSQEYLEELIRLTYPSAKVNDIVPFTIWLFPFGGSGHAPDTLPFNQDVIYFAQITSAYNGDTSNIFNQASYQLTLAGYTFTFFGTTDFILFDSVFGNIQGIIVTGWKITLNNTIKNISSVELPPEIINVDGSVSNLLVFYSPPYTLEDGGENRLAVNVKVNGSLDQVELFVGGVSYGVAPASNPNFNIDLSTKNPIVPFEVKVVGQKTIRGTLYTGNQVVQTITGKLAHVTLADQGYDFLTHLVRLYFTNIEPGSVLLISTTNHLGVKQTVTVNSTTGDYALLRNSPVSPASVTPLWIVEVTVTVNGVTCPFNFVRQLYWV